MRQQNSFIQRLNGVNFGKRAMVLSGVALMASLVVKIFFVPELSKNYSGTFFTGFKFWLKLVENIALANLLIFFICILFFRQKLGAKLVFYMQHAGKFHPKDQWISLWLQSLIIALVIIGITTFISSTLFNSWLQYIILVVLICLPFVFKNKLRNLQHKPY